MAMPIAGTERLKATEAAVVARVGVRDVHRVIDEGILSANFISLDSGRHVLAAGCVLIGFYFESANRLTAEERLFAIRAAEPRLEQAKSGSLSGLLDEDWIVRDAFLAIDFAPFVKGTSEQLDRLAAAREMVVSVPDILSGTPVIRGTRVPAYDVAALAARSGTSLEELLEMYPSLDAEEIELATIFCEANPQRGRPRSFELPEGARIITERRVRQPAS